MRAGQNIFLTLLSCVWFEFSPHQQHIVAGFISVEIHHIDRLHQVLDHRPADTAVITVANHHSCMDEPLIWGGLLDLRQLWNSRLMRWALSAHDICFSRPSHAKFFSFGKSIPVVRGDGLQQQGVRFCSERIEDGNWIHIYPEGKVNDTKQRMRLKWGVGHLTAVASKIPVVIPIYHLGMDRVLPMRKPYIPRPFQRVTFVVGEPIPVEPLLKKLGNASAEEKRKAVTDLVQEKLYELQIECEIRHAKRW